MPEDEYVWLPREHILHFEEIERLARVFVGLGAARLRLTGGEPLLRRELPQLVQRLAGIDGLRDLALTTNGVLLADQAAALGAAGLHRVTVSLDTLDRERFRALTRMDALDAVQRGIEAAADVFGGLKIDTVVIRGVNDDEMFALLDFARAFRAELRFIEYMDVGGATRWSMDRVVPREEILARVADRYGPVTDLPSSDWAPADRFALADGTSFGIISSTTAPFCRTCDRSRLTADGLWLLCLYARSGTDLRAWLRAGLSDEEIATRVAAVWRERSDRGAEVRATERDRSPLIPLSGLRRDPHLEMHTRGG
jgi:cyclic pyranopterin phosphate synthase